MKAELTTRVTGQVTMTMDWEQFEHLYALSVWARMCSPAYMSPIENLFTSDGHIAGVKTTARGMGQIAREIHETYEEARSKGLQYATKTYAVGSPW